MANNFISSSWIIKRLIRVDAKFLTLTPNSFRHAFVIFNSCYCVCIVYIYVKSSLRIKFQKYQSINTTKKGNCTVYSPKKWKVAEIHSTVQIASNFHLNWCGWHRNDRLALEYIHVRLTLSRTFYPLIKSMYINLLI